MPSLELKPTRKVVAIYYAITVSLETVRVVKALPVLTDPPSKLRK